MQTIDLSAPEHVTRILNLAWTMKAAAAALQSLNEKQDYELRNVPPTTEENPYQFVPPQMQNYLDADVDIAQAAIDYATLLSNLERAPSTLTTRDAKGRPTTARVWMEDGTIRIQVEEPT